MAEDITLDQMILELGGTPPTPAPTPAPAPASAGIDPAPAPGTDPAPAPAVIDPAPAPAPAAAPTPTPDPKAQQAQHAFENMRMQNKRYADTLKNVAEMLEISPDAAKDPDKLLAALQQKATESKAQKSNVPVELLTRLQMLEERDQASQAQQRETAAAVGFQRVKDTYGLTDTQLNGFAADLLKAGMNPLEQTVDLVSQYKVLHFDELQAKAVADAVAAEQARAAKAAKQSTTPGAKQGAGGSGEPAKVSSVQDLSRWLDQNVK